MKKNELINKTLAGLMIAAMTAGVCPTTAFAVTGKQIPADNTYTKTVRVEPDANKQFDAYDIQVSLTVKDGKFSAISVQPIVDDNYDEDNDSYIEWALKGRTKKGVTYKGFNSLEGQDATEATVTSWDTVTGATCVSNAIKEAAATAIKDAPEAKAEVDTAALQAAIDEAKKLNESDYTSDSWAKFATALEAAEKALTSDSQDDVNNSTTALKEAQAHLQAQVKVDTAALQAAIDEAKTLNEADYTANSWKTFVEALAAAEKATAATDQTTVNEALKNLTDAQKALVKATVSTDVYVLMNIPYDKFYEAEGDKDDVDAVTSATLNKTRSSHAAGSYHVNSNGSDITGVTYPVKISDALALGKYKKITDDSKVDITTSIKGKTSTTTYTGKDALFESDSYSYYILSETPSYYKEATVNADGSLSFGKAEGTEVKTLSNVTANFKTSSNYGDYQINLSELPSDIKTVYGVVIGTKEGDNYGLRHVENIYKNTKLAWSTGFVTKSHGSPLQYRDYVNMMGQTIDKITYYTNAGIYEIPVDIKVPVKFTHDLEVANAAITAGKTGVTVTGLPDDYAAEYKVDGLDGVSVQNGVLTFRNAKKGKYTLTISDKNGKYADITTEFELYTEAMPAAYDADKKALVKTADATDEEFADYIENITVVNVNGKDYRATGRGATVIINKDGSIKTDAAPFAEGDTFEITVSATGYLPQSFTYTTKEAPAPAEVNTEALAAAIAKAEGLKEADYTADSWKAMQTSLTAAKAALEAKESQEAVDAAAANLQSSIDALKAATPSETDDKKAVDTATLEKTIATAKGLKKNDYTAATWTTLQTALTNAEKALDAKESQKSVDEAAKTLQAAIDGLKKASDTTATTDDKKNNNSNKNNNNSTNKNNTTTNKNNTTRKNSPKTGDPVSVLGLLGAAISSVGIGGLGLRLRKKSKREDEE